MDIIINPMVTLLLVLYHLLGQNVFFAIVVFTVIVRLAIMPLTLKQQRSLKNMQKLAPELKELQKKYKDDRERLVQEQMALYKKHGVNPLAGCWPILIQLPIIFGLWRAIVYTLASTPDALLNLERRIWFRGLLEDVFGLQVDSIVPLNNSFLWLNLAVPDPYYVLPVLVVITSLFQQRLLMPPMEKPARNRTGNQPPDPSEQAAQMTRQLTMYMPFFFGFISLTYSSGLSIYFVTANIIGTIQYTLMGKADIRRLIGKGAPTKTDESDGSVELAEATAGGVSGRRLKPGITEVRLASNPTTRRSANTATPRPTSSVSAKERTAPKSATARRTSGRNAPSSARRVANTPANTRKRGSSKPR